MRKVQPVFCFGFFVILLIPEFLQSEEIKENLSNLLNSISKNDARKTETFRKIIKLEALREQQDFNKMKEDLRLARLKNIVKRSNINAKIEVKRAASSDGINNTAGPNMDELLKTIDSKKVKLDSTCPLSADEVQKVRAELNLMWTYHSNAIGGNRLSKWETKAVIEGLNMTGGTSREVAEVKNHYAAIEYVESVVQQKIRLTDEHIRRINFLILRNIQPGYAGNYRQENVIIPGVSFIPPQYTYVEELMEKLLVWYHRSNDMHPIMRVSIFHAKFEQIHPFMDGNGRTGRLIMNMELMKMGYPLAVIHFTQRQFYYNALTSAQVHGRFEDLTVQIANCVEDSLNMYLNAPKNNNSNSEKCSTK